MQKLKGGALMTDTCKSAHKTNRLLSQIVDGHSLFCHYHQRIYKCWSSPHRVLIFVYSSPPRDPGSCEKLLILLIGNLPPGDQNRFHLF